MPLNYGSVQSSVNKGTAQSIPLSESLSLGLLLDNSFWKLKEPVDMKLYGLTIEKKTEALINRLKRLHSKSNDELKKGQSYLRQGVETLSAGVKVLLGKRPMSYFDSMVAGMRDFGKYITGLYEKETIACNDKIDFDVENKLVPSVKEMVERYVDHSMFRKIHPVWKSLKANNCRTTYTKDLIGTLCGCIDDTKKDSWLSNVKNVIDENAESKG